jgi:hypothetical protein
MKNENANKSSHCRELCTINWCEKQDQDISCMKFNQFPFYFLCSIYAILSGCSHTIPNYSKLLNGEKNSLAITISPMLGGDISIGGDPLELSLASKDWAYFDSPISIEGYFNKKYYHISPSISPFGAGIGTGFKIPDKNITSLYCGVQFYSYKPVFSLQNSVGILKYRQGNLSVTYMLTYAPFSSINGETMNYLNFERNKYFFVNTISFDCSLNRSWNYDFKQWCFSLVSEFTFYKPFDISIGFRLSHELF